MILIPVSAYPLPVAVILPEDIFDDSTDAELNQPRPYGASAPRDEDMQQLTQMLADAERPLVLVGGALMADAIRDPQVFADLNERWMTLRTRLDRILQEDVARLNDLLRRLGVPSVTIPGRGQPPIP